MPDVGARPCLRPRGDRPQSSRARRLARRWLRARPAVLASHGSAAAPVVPGADQIVTKTLPNGMKIVVWPDRDIPNVAMYTWYRVGSRNERPGITGISHFFEHMMFNGTKTRAARRVRSQSWKRNGGRNNAYTSSDVTVYQNWFPQHRSRELIFDLESDRMRNLDFDPKKSSRASAASCTPSGARRSTTTTSAR